MILYGFGIGSIHLMHIRVFRVDSLSLSPKFENSNITSADTSSRLRIESKKQEESEKKKSSGE